MHFSSYISEPYFHDGVKICINVGENGTSTGCNEKNLRCKENVMLHAVLSGCSVKLVLPCVDRHRREGRCCGEEQCGNE